MAFGIDDVLMAAAAGLNLTDTVVQTVKAHGKKKGDLDIERLIEEVRVTALDRLDGADRALVQLERTLVEMDVDLNKALQEVIRSTPMWHPFQSYRLKHIRASLNALADATYSACDDIAALARCRQQTQPIGTAVVASAQSKHALNDRILNAKSVKVAIDILRDELASHKRALGL